VAIPQGGQIRKEPFFLPGVIGGRPGMFHRALLRYNMKTETIFILYGTLEKVNMVPGTSQKVPGTKW
jgi:hypothetical protein